MITKKLLICCDCAKTFAFDVGEQEFFKEKGLVNEPKRCHNCRLISKVRRNGGRVEELAELSCAQCAEPVMVSFQPTLGRPVYCTHCFVERRNAALNQPDLPVAQQVS